MRALKNSLFPVFALQKLFTLYIYKWITITLKIFAVHFWYKNAILTIFHSQHNTMQIVFYNKIKFNAITQTVIHYSLKLFQYMKLWTKR